MTTTPSDTGSSSVVPSSSPTPHIPSSSTSVVETTTTESTSVPSGSSSEGPDVSSNGPQSMYTHFQTITFPAIPSSMPSSSPEPTRPHDSAHILNAGAIAGVVIGLILVITLVALALHLVRRRALQRTYNDNISVLSHGELPRSSYQRMTATLRFRLEWFPWIEPRESSRRTTHTEPFIGTCSFLDLAFLSVLT